MAAGHWAGSMGSTKGSDPVKLKQQLAYLGCSLAAGVFSAFNNFTLALWLSGLTSSYLIISLFGNTRSFEGAIVQPAVGAWSDRTWLGWLGRRRPFILVGGLLSATLLAFTPAISRVPLPDALKWLSPEVGRLAPAIACIFLFTLAYNAMGDTHGALLADLTEGAERNRLASWGLLVNMFGQFGILGLVAAQSGHGIPDTAFLITGAIMAAGVLVTALGVNEPAPEEWGAREVRKRDAAADARASRPSLGSFLREYRGAAFFCLVVFAYWAGVNAVMPLIAIYTKDVLGTTDAEAQLLPALLLLSTCLCALPMGWLGSRFGKRRVISAGYAVMGIGALAGLVVTTKEQGAAVFFLAGIGNAAALVLTIPLLADLVPRKHIGLANGALAAAGSVAAPISSFVAGALADYYGTPRVIFAIMATMISVALLFMLGVRTPAEARESTVLAPQYV
jgi:Na+/melibiose symporter-like transporter